MSEFHVLMILTSHDVLGDTGEPTGFWLEEFAAPYYIFIDAGIKVTLASIQGGSRRLILKVMPQIRKQRQLSAFL